MTTEQLTRPFDEQHLEKARIAAFAVERLTDHGDQRHIYRQLGKAGLDLGSVFKWPVEDEKEDTSGADTECTIATARDYEDFLSTRMDHDSIVVRAELLQNYDRFRSEVHRVNTEVAAAGRPKDHPNHLGKGTNADVITINVDGKQYAVRIMFNAPEKVRVADGYVGGALLAKGHPRFEQLAAISYEDGVTVGEILPGKKMGALSPEEYTAITDAQLDNFVDDLFFAHEKGIMLDPKPDNFHYDPEIGICMLDLDSISTLPSYQEPLTIGEIAGQMAGMIENSGFYSKHGHDKIFHMKTEDYAREAVEMGARLEVLRRYRNSVVRKLDTPEREIALEDIDRVIDAANERFVDYTNPEWVQATIASNAEYLEEQTRIRRDQSDFNVSTFV
jgi:hypothetical protein